MDIQSLKEIVKDVALYIMPIVSVIFSGIALWKTRKVSKMEDKIREYDAFIKKAEVDKIKAEQMRIPKAQIDARVTKISANKHKIYVYNKGDAIAYNVDYELEEGSCVSKIGNNMTPFEKLKPGGHFEEPVFVFLGGTGPKFRITITWVDESGVSHNDLLIKGIE